MGKRTAATAALLMALLAGCGGGGEAETADLPGDYGQIIAGESDCGALQAVFDSGEAAGYVDVMKAADEKMQQVGCYGTDA